MSGDGVTNAKQTASEDIYQSAGLEKSFPIAAKMSFFFPRFVLCLVLHHPPPFPGIVVLLLLLPPPLPVIIAPALPQVQSSAYSGLRLSAYSCMLASLESAHAIPSWNHSV